MTNFLELPFRLRISDFDQYRRISPVAVFDLFQELATRQAAMQGIGLDDLCAKGVMWALIRQVVEVVEQPEMQSEVLVATWPHSPSRFSFLRDYSMRTPEGRLLVKGTSEWVMMDLETRAFVSIMDIYDQDIPFREERMYERKPRKLKDFEAVGEPLSMVPGFSDVDVNGHVNNAKYLNYVLDAHGMGPDDVWSRVQVDFRQEVLCGEEVQVHTRADEDGLHAKGLAADGSIKFASLITLQ